MDVPVVSEAGGLVWQGLLGKQFLHILAAYAFWVLAIVPGCSVQETQL